MLYLCISRYLMHEKFEMTNVPLWMCVTRNRWTLLLLFDEICIYSHIFPLHHSALFDISKWNHPINFQSSKVTTRYRVRKYSHLPNWQAVQSYRLTDQQFPLIDMSYQNNAATHDENLRGQKCKNSNSNRCNLDVLFSRSQETCNLRKNKWPTKTTYFLQVLAFQPDDPEYYVS